MSEETEIIARAIVPNKDPGFLYFLDSEGNVCKRKKEGMSHKYTKKRKIFTELNLTIPRFLVKSYMSRKSKEVKMSGNKKSGILNMPLSLVGMKGRVIIIPESELEKEGVNIF